jgi:hypothetical protein
MISAQRSAGAGSERTGDVSCVVTEFLERMLDIDNDLVR